MERIEASRESLLSMLFRREVFSTLNEALQSFLASREQTIQFVNTNKDDLRRRIAVHPIIGTVNCHEFCC